MKTGLTPKGLAGLIPSLTEARATELLQLIDLGLETFPVLDTKPRLMAFLAQTSVESGNFTKVRESLNYSVKGLLNGFGRNRISEADCLRLGRKDNEGPLNLDRQRAIANTVYAGRFGNTQPNDGWDYRGGGPLQLTFRDNYRACGVALQMPLDANPTMIEDPVVGMLAAMWYFVTRVSLEAMDKGFIDTVSRQVNGGDNGLEDRRQRYKELNVPGWIR